MTNQMIVSTILMVLALICYSIGVWSERIAGRLKAWHVVFFWLGLVFDTMGTGMMMGMAGALALDVHSLTGVAAIVLMIIHAVWATVVLVRKDERAILSFHKFSVVVGQLRWHAIWLIPFCSGVLLPMGT
jgi:uncharacterized repeat protein (TIGR03987 family)